MEYDEAERLREALAIVQRDLAAAGVHEQVRLLRADGAYVVALEDGSFWGGGPDLDAGDDDVALSTVAEGVQDLLADVLNRLWPVCPDHDLGLHVVRGPAWWCSGGHGHIVGEVGRLAPAPERGARP